MRSVVFAVCAAFILLAPAYGHVLRGRNPLPPRWMMFSGKGLDVLEIRLETLDASSHRVPVDRFERLGYASRAEAPRWLLTVRDREQLDELARKLCRKLRGAPLYVYARGATHKGWKELETGTEDVCARRKAKKGGRK